MNDRLVGASRTDSDELPLVSVIVPIKHHLGHAFQCVESWSLKQTYPRERLEIIVVTDGTEPKVENEIRPLLAPGDRLVVDHSKSYYAHLNTGGKNARGDILFFTESHAWGLPDCIEQVVRYLETTDSMGASTAMIGATNAFFDSLLDTIYEEDDFVTLQDENTWRKLALRGFALRRSIFLEHGPMEDEYGIFSERAVAIRFHQNDVKLGYASNAIVKHYSVPDLPFLGLMVQSYIGGESLYRSRFSAEHCQSYLGQCPWWSARVEHRKDIAKSRLGALMSHLMRSFKQPDQWFYAAGRLKDLLDHFLCALLGIDWAIAKAEMRLQLQQAKFGLAMRWCRGQCLKLIRDYWYIYLAPHCWLLSFKRMPQTMELTRLSNSNRIEPASCEDTVALGFFAAEESRAMRFRWSYPEALIRVSVPKGNYLVEIEILPDIVDLGRLNLTACFDGRVIAPANAPRTANAMAPLMVSDKNRLSFELKETDFSDQSEHLFSFACRPTSCPNDHRRLGIPVTAITFRNRESALEAKPPRIATELVGSGSGCD